MAISKQHHICGIRALALRVMLKSNDCDQTPSRWGCSLAETGYAFERSTWISWNSLPWNCLLTEHKPWCKPFVEKEFLFHQELPSLKEDSNLQECVSMMAFQEPQHAALFPGGHWCHQKQINHHVHMQEVLDLAANLQWPATGSSSCCIRVPCLSVLVFPRTYSASPGAPSYGWGVYMELNSQSQG